MFGLLVPGLVIVALASFGRRADRTVDGFARAHSLPLDDGTRRFLSFHLARMRWHRQVGGSVGLVIGLALLFVVPGGFLVTCVSVLGGSVLGMAVGELARWFGPVDRPQRVASLTPRSRATFVSGQSAWIERLMIGLLVVSGAGAIWQTHARRPAAFVVVGLGAAALLVNRVVGRRIALRAAVTGANLNLIAADRAVRFASVDVLATLVASLVLCVVTWLLVAAAPDEQRVILGGVSVLDLPTGAHDIALQGTDTAVDVTWRTADGASRSTTVTWPVGVGSGPSSMGVVPRHPTARFVVGLFALLMAACAYGEWRRVSRVAFSRSTAPARRSSRVPA